MPWDADLMPGPALDFAASDARVLRALAGPGTGKSFALRRRVARLLESGAEAQRIFVVTFTRTAAQDLVDSLRELGEEHLAEIRVRTLHAFCFGVLGQEGVLHATGRVPRIALEFESDLLLYDLGAGFGSIHDRRRLRRAFEAAWARLQSDAPGLPVAGLDQAFQDALLAQLGWHRAMVIGEVVPITHEYLRHNALAPERDAFEHVVVDEYQDLNKAEQVVVDLLAGRNLAVIGDDDQSIYGFKSANPEGIRTFPAAHAGTVDITFSECRRCPQRVVQMAQALIERNPGRDRAALQPRAGNPVGEIHHVQWRSIEAEAAGLAEFIERKVATGVRPGKVLVLAGSRQIGYAIRDSVRLQGLEIHSFFREEAVERMEARRALTLLTLLARPDDRLAMRAWLSFEANNNAVAPYRRLKAAADERGCDVDEVLRLIDAGDLAVPYAAPSIDRWRELQRIRSQLEPLFDDFSALVDALLPTPEGDEEDDMAVLRSIAVQCADEAETLESLADSVRYRIAQPEVPLETEYARVMSFHKSKGLTADLVVLAGLNEGLMPRLEGETDLEEQRRLFFVGMTRTTSILVLSSYSTFEAAMAHQLRLRRGPFLPDGTVRVYASRFLSELGPSLPVAVAGNQWIAEQRVGY